MTMADPCSAGCGQCWGLTHEPKCGCLCHCHIKHQWRVIQEHPTGETLGGWITRYRCIVCDVETGKRPRSQTPQEFLAAQPPCKGEGR